MTIQEAWETIKKAQTPNSNGELDTVEWIYRSAVKLIEPLIPKDVKVDVHPKQISIEDMGF